MAIFNPNTTSTTEVTDDIANKEIQAPTYVFESDTELANIVKQLSGYKWTVVYYHAINNETDNNITLDLSADEIIYEYNLIHDMILFVDQPLDNTQPTEITGSAYIDASIIPTPTDIFTSKLIDGRLGIFTITSIDRQTYNNRYTYKIEYKLYTIIDPNDTTILDKIKNKVVNEYYYNKDYLRKEDKVILTKSDVDIRKELNDMLNSLVNVLNKKLITKDTRYLYSTYLENYGLIYDPYLEELLLRTYELTDITPRYAPLQVNDVEKYNNIINSIVTNNRVVLDKYAKVVTALEYNNDPKIFSIIYTGVRWIVLTTDEEPDIELFIWSYDNYKPIRLDSYIFGTDFYDYLSGNNPDYELDNMEYCVASIYNKTLIDMNRIRSYYNDLLRMNHNQLYYNLPILGYTIKYMLLNSQSVTTL